MKLSFNLLCIVILLGSLVSAQNFRLPFREAKLWGYADENGKIMVKPKYDSVSIDQNNYRWFVFKNNKAGIIDSLGKEILATVYDSIERNPLHSADTDYYIFKNKKVGYADINGNIIFDCQSAKIHACSEIRFGKKSNFLIQQNPAELWQLKDASNSTIISNIEDFHDYHDGTYTLKINNLWGLYNVSLRKWILNAEYETIDYLDYEDFYQKKKEYEPYRLYAKNKNTYTLITHGFQTKSFTNSYADFFEKSTSTGQIYSTISPPELVAVPISINYSTDFPLLFYTSDRSKLKQAVLTEKNKKLGLKLFFTNTESKEITPEYNEIKLLREGGDYYNNQVALVRKSKKWGLLSLTTQKLITPITYDDIAQYKVPYVLILKDDKKIGLFEVASNRNNNEANWVQPEYDSLETFNFATSLDGHYRSYEVFYFKKNGQWHPVGKNGLKLYKD